MTEEIMSRSMSSTFSLVSKTVILALSVLVLGTAAGHAHAHLSRAEPRVDSTVASAPQQVTLSFTEDLESTFSTIEVRDAKGARMDDGEAQINGRIMRIGLKPLSQGAYKVLWRALSVDTHKTEGTFMFRVGE
jgi:copper resistance protein C